MVTSAITGVLLLVWGCFRGERGFGPETSFRLSNDYQKRTAPHHVQIKLYPLLLCSNKISYPLFFLYPHYLYAR